MKTDNLVLRPNCLLTKYPLVFLTGIRSLFFYEKLGGPLQDFIAAHGYAVLSPALPFRSKNLRKAYLQHWFKQQESKQFHFILSEKTFDEFRDILKDYPASSFTVTSRDLGRYELNSPKEPFSYKLHKLFCRAFGAKADFYSQTLQDKSPEFYDRFLDHCIELAENEII